ncbi:hypothetical protein [Streptosporangium sp. NBC_01756]|uniref:hypothetical protein n=1 Tax=Streptosporangium sp. NBC_01756 TaxID=2975950 RepID=UPI002DD9B27D|nr:hypothetical protein [Streptosporangium sp. NBC_01756]WSC85831.1 hypothetical protein OIE48_36600 [Streptosporangium sp. NBC_01756]
MRSEHGSRRLPPRSSASYDTVTVDYGKLLSTELADKPLDRAMLAAFAELVRATGAGPVAVPR